MLFAYSGDGCIECGASVSGGRNCSGVGLKTVTDDAQRAYDRIVQSAPADGLGFVRQTVALSGEVIAIGKTGRPMIRATHLRLAKTDGS